MWSDMGYRESSYLTSVCLGIWGRRRLIALHAWKHVGSDPAGLYINSESERPFGDKGHLQTCTEERAAADHNAARPFCAGIDRRKRDLRKHIRHPRHGAAILQGGYGEGLSPRDGDPHDRCDADINR